MSSGWRVLEIDSFGPLPLPSSLVEYRSSGGAVVVVAPDRATWCVLDGDLPATLFRQLRSGMTPDAAMHELAHSAGPTAAERAMQQVLVELDDKGLLSHQRREPSGQFKHLKLNLTDACNLRCEHCYRFCAKALQGELTVDEWRRVVTEHASAGGTAISVSGGEPLCRLEDCLSLLALAREHGMQSVLLTNGTLVVPSVAERLASLVDEVQVSLDGPTKEVSETIRGSGTWDRTVRAIHELVDRQVLVRIAMTPLPSTLEAFQDGMADFVDHIAGTFGDGVVVQLGGMVLDGRNVSGCTGCNLKSWDETIASMRSRVFGVDYRAMIDAVLLEPNVRQETCGYGASFCIEPDGTTLPCDLCRQRSLGSVTTDARATLEERLRDAALSMSVDASPICGQCDLRYVCGGTCRIDDERTFGDPLRPSCDGPFKQDLIDRLAAMNRYRYEVDEQ